MNHYTSCYADEPARSLKGTFTSLLNPALAVVLVALFTWTLM